MTCKEWIDVFNAFLTPLIAILAVYIAWKQYQIEHHSLRSQLYERRMAVFKAYMSFLAEVMRDGNTNFQRLGQFYAEASEADFLFSDRFGKKREEIYKKGLDLISTDRKLTPSDAGGLPVGSERTKVADENSDLLKWFKEQIAETRDLFKSEMKIG